jgi:hypothetical protein
MLICVIQYDVVYGQVSVTDYLWVTKRARCLGGKYLQGKC